MSTPAHFERVGTRGFYRPRGVVSFEQAIDEIALGLECARSLGLVDLVVNSFGLSGFPVPSTFGRYAFAVRWAEAAGGALRVAFVARPELIDRDKIGMTMSQNRGLDANVFDNEADAVQWLDARCGPRR